MIPAPIDRPSAAWPESDAARRRADDAGVDVTPAGARDDLGDLAHRLRRDRIAVDDQRAAAAGANGLRALGRRFPVRRAPRYGRAPVTDAWRPTGDVANGGHRPLAEWEQAGYGVQWQSGRLGVRRQRIFTTIDCGA